MTYANMHQVEIKKGDQTGTSTISAYEKVWRKNGWTLVERSAPAKVRREEEEVTFEGGLPPVDDGNDTKAGKPVPEKKEGAK